MINLIDPGHDGGSGDPGAIAGNIKEADLTIKFANRVKSLLENYQTTLLTRHYGDYDPPTLNERLKQASAVKANRYISIHCNSCTTPDAKGLEVFYKIGCPQSEFLAQNLLEEIVYTCQAAGYKYINRGIKTANLFINHAPCPAVLIETGFMSNPDELNWLTSPLGQITIGYAIAKALL